MKYPATLCNIMQGHITPCNNKHSIIIYREGVDLTILPCLQGRIIPCTPWWCIEWPYNTTPCNPSIPSRQYPSVQQGWPITQTTPQTCSTQQRAHREKAQNKWVAWPVNQVCRLSKLQMGKLKPKHKFVVFSLLFGCPCVCFRFSARNLPHKTGPSQLWQMNPDQFLWFA